MASRLSSVTIRVTKEQAMKIEAIRRWVEDDAGAGARATSDAVQRLLNQGWDKRFEPYLEEVKAERGEE